MDNVTSTPPLTLAQKEAFQQLLRLAEDEDALLLMSCLDRETGDQRAVICAHYVDETGRHAVVPLAELFHNDPFAELVPPEAPLEVS